MFSLFILAWMVVAARLVEHVVGRLGEEEGEAGELGSEER